jgi:hypothetical protein
MQRGIVASWSRNQTREFLQLLMQAGIENERLGESMAERIS